MRVHYIAPKHVVLGSVPYFKDSHWLELPDGSVLLSAAFHRDDHQDRFEEHTTVMPLPPKHSTEVLSDEHVNRLGHLGIVKGHSMKQALAHIKKNHHRGL